jgi:lysophospholipase L1-like esterase
MSSGRGRWYGIALVLAVGATALAAPGVAKDRTGAAAASGRWIAAWGATPEGSAVAEANSSVRNIARISAGGSRVRIRLSNPGEGQPLVVGAATIGLQKGTVGAEVVAGTIRKITFRGRPGITLPPKTDAVYSDPVDFPVRANQNVAITLHLPSSTNPDVGGAQWNSSYYSAADAGDKSRDPGGSAFTTARTATYALTGVDVLTRDVDGAIVGFGSSTLHGSNSTRDGYDRVLDLLITRSQQEVPAGRRKAIVGAGIGGDTLHAAVARFQRDVLSQTGVSAVIVWVTNDLATRNAAQIIEDYEIVIKQARAAGVRVFCPTWVPGAQSLAQRAERAKLNEWIMNSGRCDDNVDWDRAMRNDVVNDTYKVEYFSDGIHPNAAGHAALSRAVPRRWFTS